MKKNCFLFIYLFSTFASASSLDFDKTVLKINKSVQCLQAKTLPASDGYGMLYSCISGQQGTAKIYINENPGKGTVKNIKIMWNDYFKDVGYGTHLGHVEAYKFVDTVTDMLVPSVSKKLQANFIGHQNFDYETKEFAASYKYHKGPAIEERLITLTPK